MQTNFTIYKNFIAQYKVTPQIIYNTVNLPRLNRCKMDCVVNAMEIIGVINKEEAGIERTRIGPTGIIPEHFLQKFNQVNPEYIYKFVQISMNELIPWVNKDMPKLTMIFCGYKDQNNNGHVYIIAKDYNGNKFLLDPQMNPPICELINMDCFSYISNKSSYYILVRDNVPMNVDEEDKVDDDVIMSNDIDTKRIRYKRYYKRR